MRLLTLSGLMFIFAIVFGIFGKSDDARNGYLAAIYLLLASKEFRE